MVSETQHIKNMVCPRCITAVEAIYGELGIRINSISLGTVKTTNALLALEKESLAKLLSRDGFELLEDEKAKLIGRIKGLIVQQIHHSEVPMKTNLSTLLSESLAQDYSVLSKLFSSVEGITIERFVLKQKIEKVKEFILYKQFNLSEIAFKLGYSSVAHLSAQFKKETGMTPTAFSNMDNPKRSYLNDI